MNQAISGRRKSILSWLVAAGLWSSAALSFTSPGAAATPDGARVVKYSKEDIIPVRAKLRFSTLIVLPESEEILDFTTGDKEFWIINGAHNLCYVHPAQAGIRSNLNLITASGHVYSFLLTEVGNDANAAPDLKLFIEPKDGAGFTSELPLHGYVRATESEAYKKELDTLRAQTSEQVRAAQAEAAQQVGKFRADYQSKLQFDYNIDAKALREPFLVSVIYHDDAFTYIKCAAREKPTLYEVKDGKPSLINFQLANGVYIVPKVLNAGYLAVGMRKVVFARRTSAN
jgi:type IV secretion system protein VirB9